MDLDSLLVLEFTYDGKINTDAFARFTGRSRAKLIQVYDLYGPLGGVGGDNGQT